MCRSKSQQAIHLSLRIDVLIGNIQVCILRYVLQQSRVVSLQAYLRMARITNYALETRPDPP